jgi:hypothetical protein
MLLPDPVKPIEAQCSEEEFEVALQVEGDAIVKKKKNKKKKNSIIHPVYNY